MSKKKLSRLRIHESKSLKIRLIKTAVTAVSLHRQKKNNLQGRNEKRVGTTLAQVANPDEIVISEAALCEHCQENLSDIPALNIDKRQVTDISPVKAYTTEYQGEIKQCPHCHH